MSPVAVPTIERFWSHVEESTDTYDDGTQITPCLHWTALVENGYGYFSPQAGIKIGAHRWLFIETFGPIEPLPSGRGRPLDHLCHNADRSCPGGKTCRHRRCVNLLHLEPVTPRENVQRGWWGRRETCINNHPFTPENTRISGTVRVCLQCRKDRRERVAALFAAGVLPKRPPTKEHCKYDHPLVPENIFYDKRGIGHCKTCRNIRTSTYKKRKRAEWKAAGQGRQW